MASAPIIAIVGFSVLRPTWTAHSSHQRDNVGLECSGTQALLSRAPTTRLVVLVWLVVLRWEVGYCVFTSIHSDFKKCSLRAASTYVHIAHHHAPHSAPAPTRRHHHQRTVVRPAVDLKLLTPLGGVHLLVASASNHKRRAMGIAISRPQREQGRLDRDRELGVAAVPPEEIKPTRIARSSRPHLGDLQRRLPSDQHERTGSRSSQLLPEDRAELFRLLPPDRHKCRLPRFYLLAHHAKRETDTHCVS